MSGNDKCPFCFEPTQHSRENSGLAAGVDCPRCGKFKIYRPLIDNLDENQRTVLSGLTRHKTELNAEPLLITTENLEDLIAAAPKQITEKAILLLEMIARWTTYFGESVNLQLHDDFPVAFAKNVDEFRTFVNLLHDEGLVTRESWSSAPDIGVIVTARGFEKIDARASGGLNSDTAFVAMSFHEEIKSAYVDGIGPAITDCGYRPVRIDLEEHNDDIIHRVFSEIRKSRFVVADFTRHRNGVYFEAGFALGLSIPVIWLCHSDHMGEAHFDTEHFNHISWSHAAELRERLALRISSTIGTGPRIHG